MNIHKLIRHGFFSLALIFLLMAVPYGFLKAQEKPQYRAGVNLNVEADSQVKLKLTNYLKSELLSVDYVDMVNDSADWKISIVSEHVSVPSTPDSLIIISVVFSKPFDNELFSFLVNEKYKDIFMASSKNLQELKSQIIYSGREEDLKILSGKIVNDFKRKFLEREKEEFDITNMNLNRLTK